MLPRRRWRCAWSSNNKELKTLAANNPANQHREHRTTNRIFDLSLLLSLRNTYHRLDKRTDDDDIDIIIIFILIKSIVVLLAIVVVGSISAIFDHKVVLQIANQSVHHPRKTQAVAVATGVSIRRVLVDWYSTCRNISLNFSVYTVLKTKYHGTSSPISDEYIRFLLHYKFSCKHYVHKLSTIFN